MNEPALQEAAKLIVRNSCEGSSDDGYIYDSEKLIEQIASALKSEGDKRFKEGLQEGRDEASDRRGCC